MRNQLFTQVAVPALALACSVGCDAGPAGLEHAKPAASPDDKPVATLKVQAREVLLPVTVRDKKGAFVTSLDKGDFTLTEDGRPQNIKSFTHEANLPYKIGLLVDTSRSVSGALENERKAGGMFVDTMLPAEPRAKDPDEAFLIHFDRAGGAARRLHDLAREDAPRARQHERHAAKARRLAGAGDDRR